MDAKDAGFWDAVSARVQPAGMAAMVEDPRTIVRIVTAALWFSAANTALNALIFVWFQEPGAAWIAVLLGVAYLGAWVLFVATGSVHWTTVVVVAASATGVVGVHVALGGYANSGAWLFWFITLALSTALGFRRNVWMGLATLFAVVAIIFGFLEVPLQSSRPAPDPVLPALLFPVVLVANLAMSSLLFVQLLGRLGFERQRAEGLLLNVLPAEVAAELKATGSTTPRHYDGISVLYADIVGFTPQSAGMDPDELVSSLNEVFTAFDAMARRHGAEKIRTIGDNYMVAAGVPVPREDHAEALAAMALDMLTYAEDSPWSFRIGINSGPAVAGVIGTEKFQYDLWGDTVNTASRMESHGEAGRIQITEATNELINETFTTTRRGPIDVKGKGTLDTWWLDTAPQPVA